MDVRGNILVCDDDEKTIYFLEQILSKKGNHKVLASTTGEECLEKYNKNIDLVILDVSLPGISGIDVLSKLRKLNPNVVVIMATAYSSETIVINSLRNGAYNYIRKPYDMDYLLSGVKEGIIESWSRKKLEAELTSGPNKVRAINKAPTLETNSPKVTALYETLKKISQKNISISLTGPSGTGKEYFAQLIHQLSNRSKESFIPVNCPAIPETLAESELFGHEKGSFTGADSTKIGKFELANGGIIFLDEIADLSLEVQAKLLRILQEREIYRVGGTKPIKVDVVLLSATSKDLQKEMDEGRFRADLFYRISDINIEVPALKERKEDLPLLVEKFIKEYTKENKEGSREFSGELIKLLQQYDWPGNIRELKSMVRKILILSNEKTICVNDPHIDLSRYFIIDVDVDIEEQKEIPTNKNNIINHNSENQSPNVTKQNVANIQDMEKNLILQSIEKNKNNLSSAAKDLGISRSTLYRKLKKYNTNY